MILCYFYNKHNMLEAINQYTVKFKDLRKNIDDTCRDISLVFSLKEVLYKPRELMTPYLALEKSDYKVKLEKAKEIVDQVKELIDLFKPLTSNYTRSIIKKLSSTLSVRDIDYVFPENLGDKTNLEKDYDELNDYIVKCNKSDATINKIINVDVVTSSMTTLQNLTREIKNLPPDLFDSLPLEIRMKAFEIKKGEEAKTAFNVLKNKFHNLEHAIGVPPRYESLLYRTLVSLKNDAEALLKELYEMNSETVHYIDSDLYHQMIKDTSKYQDELNKRIKKINSKKFWKKFLSTMIPVSSWLLLAVPLIFIFTTSIISAFNFYSGYSNIIPIFGGILGGIATGIFRYITLLLGAGYYWTDIYQGMIINPFILQIIMSVVLVLSLGLRIFYGTRGHLDRNYIVFPLVFINKTAVLALFIMPFILSFYIPMYYDYLSGGWGYMFTRGIVDGFFMTIAYLLARGFFDTVPAGIPSFSNVFLGNVLFYVYILLALFFNIIFRKIITRKFVRLGM